MLLACLWPCLCLGAVGCGSQSRAYSSQSTPTLAPRRTTPFSLQKAKERLLSCWPAAAATTATAIITIIVKLLRRCCRSTNNASRVRLITIWLIWSVFLPGSRATLAATNNASDAVVGESQLAEPDYLHASVETRGLKQMRGSNVQSPAETNLPWILGGIIVVP